VRRGVRHRPDAADRRNSSSPARRMRSRSGCPSRPRLSELQQPWSSAHRRATRDRAIVGELDEIEPQRLAHDFGPHGRLDPPLHGKAEIDTEIHIRYSMFACRARIWSGDCPVFFRSRIDMRSKNTSCAASYRLPRGRRLAGPPQALAIVCARVRPSRPPNVAPALLAVR
jgi:hypothetical protein